MVNSTIKPKPCSNCGSLYHSAMYHRLRARIAVTALPKRSKRPKQIGKGTLKYNEWRDSVARPYLIATFGERCVVTGCTVTEGLEIDHIQGRGSHPELKMVLTNLQFLCHPHHREKTDNVKEKTL